MKQSKTEWMKSVRFSLSLIKAAMNITTDQAAERLGVSRSLVIRLCRQGRIVASKVGRDWLIDERDLKHYKPRPVGKPPHSP